MRGDSCNRPRMISEPGAPEVAAYEFQSSGIIEMLEGSLGKFEKKLSQCESDHRA